MRTITLLLALMSCGTAMAADIDNRTNRLDPAPRYVNPTDVVDSDRYFVGPYVGVFGGYGWGDTEVTNPNGGVPEGPFSYDSDALLGGVTLGYSYQFNNVVVGVEAELGYMDPDGSGSIPSSSPPHHQVISYDSGFYALGAGRLGFAADRWLIYGKGGWAVFDTNATQETTKPGFTTHGTGALDGPVYGGGLEYAMSDHVRLKLEYLYFDFDTDKGSQTSEITGFEFEDTHDLDLQTVKLGVSYQF